MSHTIKPTTAPVWAIATNNTDIWIPMVVNVGSELSTGQPTLEQYTTRDEFLERLDELEIEYGDDDYVAEEVEIKPDYPAFNIYMLMNPANAAYKVAVNQVNPDLVNAVALTYNNIVDRGTSDFLQIFSLFCQVAEVNQAHRNEWANAAETCNLPSDFVNVVRGEEG